MATRFEQLQRVYAVLRPLLDERSRRLWAAAEALAIGRGGISQVAEATGMSRTTVRVGLKELESGVPLANPSGRLRSPGGGRKSLTKHDPGLVKALKHELEPHTRGDPSGPLQWTSKSAARLSKHLGEIGHPASERTVNRLLHEQGYSLQANRKTLEGRQHPDRDGQFLHIQRRVRAFQRMGQPVVSVDTKKKELVGPFRNGGKEWCPKGQPEDVRVHDFKDPELGKAIPYGIYDQTKNTGWMSVGIDHDTSVFAVETLRRWWRQMGRQAYPGARRLLITADGGGSNGSRSRLWKLELQRFTDEFGLRVSVCHFPPGTSKWNKIEHRMFSHVIQNWRGRPLVSHEVVVNLIGVTTTEEGLSIHSELDKGSYPIGIKVTDEQMDSLDIKHHNFHGEWNYTLSPRKP